MGGKKATRRKKQRDEGQEPVHPPCPELPPTPSPEARANMLEALRKMATNAFFAQGPSNWTSERIEGGLNAAGKHLNISAMLLREDEAHRPITHDLMRGFFSVLAPGLLHILPVDGMGPAPLIMATSTRPFVPNFVLWERDTLEWAHPDAVVAEFRQMYAYKSSVEASVELARVVLSCPAACSACLIMQRWMDSKTQRTVLYVNGDGTLDPYILRVIVEPKKTDEFAGSDVCLAIVDDRSPAQKQLMLLPWVTVNAVLQPTKPFPNVFWWDDKLRAMVSKPEAWWFRHLREKLGDGVDARILMGRVFSTDVGPRFLLEFAKHETSLGLKSKQPREFNGDDPDEEIIVRRYLGKGSVGPPLPSKLCC